MVSPGDIFIIITLKGDQSVNCQVRNMPSL